MEHHCSAKKGMTAPAASKELPFKKHSLALTDWDDFLEDWPATLEQKDEMKIRRPNAFATLPTVLIFPDYRSTACLTTSLII
jgi:hypothetical protein